MTIAKDVDVFWAMQKRHASADTEVGSGVWCGGKWGGETLLPPSPSALSSHLPSSSSSSSLLPLSTHSSHHHHPPGESYHPADCS